MKDNITQVTTIVYAAPLSLGRWAGLGFSADGIMVGSTALISTLNAAGVPIATVYNLLGRTSDQVVPGTGLNFVGGLPGATYDQPSSTVYVSFQVDFANSTAKSTYLLMAYGAQNSDGTLAEHDSRISTSAEFISGIFLFNLDFQIPVWGNFSGLSNCRPYGCPLQHCSITRFKEHVS